MWFALCSFLGGGDEEQIKHLIERRREKNQVHTEYRNKT